MSPVNCSGPHINKRQCLCIIWGANEGVLWEMCKCQMSSCISWLFMKIAYHLLTSMDWKFGNNEVASVITWSDKECIDIFRTNVPMNDYHTFKYRKIAPSLPEIFSKIIFRFTSPKFSLATSQSVEWRGGGGGAGEGEWRTPTYHIKVNWWVLVVSLGDRMTFYQRYHLRMLVEK